MVNKLLLLEEYNKGYKEGYDEGFAHGVSFIDQELEEKLDVVLEVLIELDEWIEDLYPYRGHPDDKPAPIFQKVRKLVRGEELDD